MNRFPHLGLVLILFLGGASGGCGGGKTTFEPTGKEKMDEIGQMLRTAQLDGTKPPARVTDLAVVEPMIPLSASDLRSGDIVYLWGAGLSTAANASSTVLAHEKKVAAEGGWALMQDGTVKHLTADEFAAAPKAGSRK